MTLIQRIWRNKHSETVAALFFGYNIINCMTVLWFGREEAKNKMSGGDVKHVYGGNV